MQPPPTAVEPLESRTLFAATPPRFDHVVTVIEENHSYSDILGTHNVMIGQLPPPQANDPYIQWLARHGASFTNFKAEDHPSQPNYMALFSGSKQGVTNDATPKKLLTAPSLGGELIKAGVSFAGYSEGLPRVG